ncbi:MAG: 30S ribosomal protein S7 [Bacillota bacterium]|jgi:small subunit ribosomal protein S7|nr:30S ribosomal protein S7 [Bacillota bacterium]MDI9414927.1 30S ribosomal protein S7 [Bacillota bacterium]NLD12131.1 30S ribosomal protein S7 [Bacillota bacterium]HAV21810.1 30S ribosomal protein S7 [Bacillota bacterium]HOB88443.1 30S ribosomal protein S7 [Bacillota bacterium]
MPRRGRIPKREVLPDPVYGNVLAAQLINKLLLDGKKGTAESIFYGAMDIIGEKTGKDPIEMFERAVKNVMPILEVRPRRVGGATYQVPVEVRPERRSALALRWIVQNARARSEKSMAEKLANELLDAVQGQGASVRKREETHRMAEANKAFAHYRW